MADALLGDLLRRVSRSFYLSLAVLPAAVRAPIGLAYLLARAADTVADTRLLPRDERVKHLDALRAIFSGSPGDAGAVARACVDGREDGAERALLARLGEATARLEALAPADAEAVRRVLATLTSGMIFDLTWFPGDDARGLAALETLEDLDRYTYLVAGCVGPFWTAVHVAHRPRLARWDLGARSAQAVRFGKALQMTNVLRDVPRDLRHGRCYLPSRELRTLGLAPADLLTPAGAERARPLLRRLLALALEHYDAAWDYTVAIPRAEWRMRLACAWPLLIGLATLAAVAAHPNPLAAETPVKISRRAVRGLISTSVVTVWSDAALRRQAAALRRRVA
jgi:farnesyl-diphosphate farnesyltransferase